MLLEPGYLLVLVDLQICGSLFDIGVSLALDLNPHDGHVVECQSATFDGSSLLLGFGLLDGHVVDHALDAMNIAHEFGGQILLGHAGGYVAQGDGAIFYNNLSVSGAQVSMEQKGGFYFGHEPRIRIHGRDFIFFYQFVVHTCNSEQACNSLPGQ